MAGAFNKHRNNATSRDLVLCLPASAQIPLNSRYLRLLQNWLRRLTELSFGHKKKLPRSFAGASSPQLVFQWIRKEQIPQKPNATTCGGHAWPDCRSRSSCRASPRPSTSGRHPSRRRRQSGGRRGPERSFP